MKIIRLLSFGILLNSGLIFGHQVVFSQEAPPPPPLIYSAPTTSDIKEFVDPDKFFKVSFPGTPDKILDSGKDTQTITYKVSRKGSESTISVLIFPIKMEHKTSEMINSYRNNLAILTRQGPKGYTSKVSNILIDREITVDGHTGREFGYESDFYYTHIAVLVIGNRFFEIKTDVTNWHILSKHKPELVKAFHTEAERFLKSFSFTK